MRNLIYRSFAMLSVMLAMVSLAYSFEFDDTVPEVTDRVARISFVSGNVQIKRSESEDWEKADLNLPVTEGDEIVTEVDGRIEIQFNSNTHLRLDGNSTLQIKQLTDDGIAVSISRGLGSVRLRKFDTEKEFFEIDAPGSTVALQKEGTYKFEAAQSGSLVRIGIRDGGEARIYSSNAGFTLRSGRAARLFVGGDFAGESDIRDISEFTDAFDTWTADRDDIIEKNLSKAHYGQYYDQDIYAADELTDYGDWQFTNDYGYVWQPNSYATRGYADWSPYRYGSWRWVPAFGWSWVNDEPWGWATYHHGRWIMYRGRWVWAPYGYYRSNRSYWYPALVVVQVINNNICWYPIGYRGRYRDYNGWNRRRGRGRDRDRDGRPGDRPTQQPRPNRNDKPTGGRVPPAPDPDGPIGVITMKKEDFGRGRVIGNRADEQTNRGILAKTGTEFELPDLPRYENVRPRLSKEIAVTPPIALPPRSTGAAERVEKKPLDSKLKETRIFGNRRPVPAPTTPQSEGPVLNREPGIDGSQRPINTGAVERPRPQVRRPETKMPGTNSPPIFSPGPQIERQVDREVNRKPTVQERSEPRPSRPEQKQTPRYEPPPRRESPPPRNDPPPRRDPSPPRSESKPSPPPSKSEPSKKPDPPAPTRKGKG